MSGVDFRTRQPRRRGHPGRRPVPAEVSKRIGLRGHVRIGVDVPPEVKAALIQVAQREGTSVSDIHRSALLAYLLGKVDGFRVEGGQ